MKIPGNFNFKDPKATKIYEGGYQYFHEQTMYCEENFEVFRNKESKNLHFFSELNTRTSDGQVFNVKVSYLVNKSYIPTIVNVTKDIGKDKISETYIYLESTNTLVYEFRSNSTKNSIEIKPPPKFYISAPSTVQSMTFLLSKRFDNSDQNYYSLYHGQKSWNYESPPQIIDINARRHRSMPKNIKVNGFKLKAIPYTIFSGNSNLDENNEGPESGSQGMIKVQVSRFHSIPYLLEEPNGSVIRIKKLTNLSSDES